MQCDEINNERQTNYCYKQKHGETSQIWQRVKEARHTKTILYDSIYTTFKQSKLIYGDRTVLTLQNRASPGNGFKEACRSTGDFCILILVVITQGDGSG